MLIRSARGDPLPWTRLPGLAALSAELRAALDAMARRREVDAGQTVFVRGEPASALVAVFAGDVAVGVAALAPVMRLERLAHGPAWLDASAVWLDSGRTLDAVALTPLQLAELPRAPLRRLLDRSPVLAHGLLAGLAAEVRGLTLHAHELKHKDAPGRLASWLLRRCVPTADEPGRGVVRLHERKRDIASQLGMTPETLSRLMRALSQRRLIAVAGYTVQVLDRPALQRLATEGARADHELQLAC